MIRAEAECVYVPSGKSGSALREVYQFVGPEGSSGARSGRTADTPRMLEQGPALAHAACAHLWTLQHLMLLEYLHLEGFDGTVLITKRKGIQWEYEGLQRPL